MLQLHPAVIVQVGGGRLADIIAPIAGRDAVDQLLLPEGGAHILMGGLHHILAVEAVVVKGLVLLVLGSPAVVGLSGRFRRQGGPAAAAGRLGTQGAFAAARAGAQRGVLVGELPLIARAVGGGVDAAAQLFVTVAVVGRTAVGADDDIVFEGERLCAALTGTAIIFRHGILLFFGSYWYYTPPGKKRKGENLQNSSRIIVLPLYFNTDCRYTNEVSVYKLYLLEDSPSV